MVKGKISGIVKNVCCAVLICSGVNMVNEVFAMRNLYDPEYMKTTLRYNTEEETRLMALDRLYYGLGNRPAIYEHEFDELERQGMRLWFEDVETFLSEEFALQIADDSLMTKCVADITLWLRVTIIGGMFEDKWSHEDRIKGVILAKKLTEKFQADYRFTRANKAPELCLLLGNLCSVCESIESRFEEMNISTTCSEVPGSIDN
jgi:hypothetical protein